MFFLAVENEVFNISSPNLPNSSARVLEVFNHFIAKEDETITMIYVGF